MSRDHHSPMESSERATGHALALKDLCRIAPRSLIARKSGCTIIPDSGILSVVASCNQTERRQVAQTDPLAVAQIEKEQNDDIQTEHSTYHVGAAAHHYACIWWGAGCDIADKRPTQRQEHSADPRRFRGRLGMGRRLQHIEEERLQHYHRSESHSLARRRRGRNKEGHCRAGWPSHPCRAFVWGRRDYGSGYRPQGGGACLCCCICA